MASWPTVQNRGLCPTRTTLSRLWWRIPARAKRTTRPFVPNAWVAIGTDGTITLTCRKAGTNPLEYIIYKLTDCIFTSVSTGGSGGEDRLTVNFTINFGAFDIKYVEQDPKGGKASEVTFAYDIAANADA